MYLANYPPNSSISQNSNLIFPSNTTLSSLLKMQPLAKWLTHSGSNSKTLKMISSHSKDSNKISSKTQQIKEKLSSWSQKSKHPIINWNSKDSLMKYLHCMKRKITWRSKKPSKLRPSRASFRSRCWPRCKTWKMCNQMRRNSTKFKFRVWRISLRSRNMKSIMSSHCRDYKRTD